MNLLKMVLVNTIITTIVVYIFSAIYFRHLTEERIDAELKRVQSYGRSSSVSTSSETTLSFSSSSSSTEQSSQASSQLSLPKVSSSEEMDVSTASAYSSETGNDTKLVDYPKFYPTRGGFDNNSCFSAPDEYGINWSEKAKEYFKDFDIYHPDLEILSNKHFHYEPSQMWFVYFKIPLPDNLINTKWTVLSFDGIVTTQPVYLKGIITYSENGSDSDLSEPSIEKGEICLEENSQMKHKKQESNLESRFVVAQSDGTIFSPATIGVSSKRVVNLMINNQPYEFNEPGYEALYNPRPFRLYGFEDDFSRVYSIIELLDYSCHSTYLIYDVVNSKIISSSGGGCD